MQIFSKFSLHSCTFTSVSRRYIRTSAKAHLVLPVELQEVVIGSILGDLGVERPNPQRNTRLQFKQTDKNMEYIMHLYSLFQEFCGTAPKFMSRFVFGRRGIISIGQITYQLIFNIVQCPCFAGAEPNLFLILKFT